MIPVGYFLLNMSKTCTVAQNCWVVYESIDPELNEAEAILQEWESDRVQRYKLTSGLDSLWTLQ